MTYGWSKQYGWGNGSFAGRCFDCGASLQENEGVVLELKGDAKFQFDETITKVIVFKHENQIIIEEADPGLNDGQMCWIHPYNPN